MHFVIACLACRLFVLCSRYQVFGYNFYVLLLVQLGPKAEDVSKPVNPITFLFRFLMGTICAAYYVLVPIYMWIKDQIVPKGMPIWVKGTEMQTCKEERIANIWISLLYISRFCTYLLFSSCHVLPLLLYLFAWRNNIKTWITLNSFLSMTVWSATSVAAYWFKPIWMHNLAGS